MTRKMKYLLPCIAMMAIISMISLAKDVPVSRSQEKMPLIKSSSFETLERIADDVLVDADISSQPAICRLTNTTICIAYTKEVNTHDEIFVKAFDATNGNNLTRDIQVSDYPSGGRDEPSVCALTDEIVVVAYEGSSYHDSNGRGISARIINITSGEFLSSVIGVNGYTEDTQENPSICALSPTTFAVSWDGNGMYSSFYHDVYVKLFDATTGLNLTGDIFVNEYNESGQIFSSTCKVNEDSFAIAWQTYNDTTSNFQIAMRVFNSTDGKDLTKEIKISEDNDLEQRDPSICALSNETVAIAWRYEVGYGDDDVHATIINITSGENITGEFLVNAWTSDDQYAPSIATISDEVFAIAWEDGTYYAGIGLSIPVRLFNSSNWQPITGELRANTDNPSEYFGPSLCGLTNQSFVVARQGDGSAGFDDHVYFSAFGPDIYVPSVSINSPAQGNRIILGVNTTIDVSIQDKGNSFNHAKVIINTTEQLNLSLKLDSSTWKCYWDNSSDYGIGYYNISIWAIDDHGNINDTQYVVVYLGYSTTSDGTPPSLPGYELTVLVLSIGIATMIIILKQRGNILANSDDTKENV